MNILYLEGEKMNKKRKMNAKKLCSVIVTVMLVLSLVIPVYGETYTYDENGRVTTVIYDDGSQETYRYDKAGNVEKVIVTTRSESTEEEEKRTTEEATEEQKDPNKDGTTQENTQGGTPGTPSNPGTPGNIAPYEETAKTVTALQPERIFSLATIMNGGFLTYFSIESNAPSLLKPVNPGYATITPGWHKLFKKSVKGKKSKKKSKKAKNSKNKKNKSKKNTAK